LFRAVLSLSFPSLRVRKHRGPVLNWKALARLPETIRRY
jgi:hypothetical protein